MSLVDPYEFVERIKGDDSEVATVSVSVITALLDELDQREAARDKLADVVTVLDKLKAPDGELFNPADRVGAIVDQMQTSVEALTVTIRELAQQNDKMFRKYVLGEDA